MKRVRVAIVSDIHGNRTAFEAVLADLRETSPDVIFHGGDLADNGSAPAEIVDWIRSLGWPGVVGNTDEMLVRPESLETFAAPLPQLEPVWSIVREMAAFARESLGEERLHWLGSLPLVQLDEGLELTHAIPGNTWRAPMPEATDADLEAAYGQLGKPVVAYGHIHRSYVRRLPHFTVANSGSVSLSHDGDSRAAYLVIDDGEPAIQRVEYDLDKEMAALRASGVPHAEWVGRNLVQAAFVMP